MTQRKLLVTSVLMTMLAVGQVSAAEDWRSVPLEDVRTGQFFTINDFVGKTVLLETFAIWCPTCSKQQDQIDQLHHDLRGEDVISISLDVDPNESPSQVREYAERKGYDWYYAVAPPEMTQMLMDEFGVVIVAASSVPVIMICPDKQARLLGRGLKTADRLQTEIAKGYTGSRRGS